MTTTEIEALPAGRELDALIAEKVMGLGFFHVVERDGDRETMRLYHTGVERYATFERHGTVHTSTVPHELPTLRYYSTDIAAAWEVVEKLGDMGGFMLMEPFPSQWACTVGGVTDGPLANTAPLAICRAALKAMQ